KPLFFTITNVTRHIYRQPRLAISLHIFLARDIFHSVTEFQHFQDSSHIPRRGL
ncbi:hypothetical protein NDU88_003339, partial [Pleurodeles waltl]